MATDFFSKTGERVGRRFFGGKDVGMCFQMEVTEREWPAWKDVQVAAETCPDFFERFEDAVANCTVVWDNAVRQNEMARDFETHRFADQVPAMASMSAECRMRARVCARDQMRSV